MYDELSTFTCQFLQSLYSQAVAVQSEATDDAYAGTANHGVVAELLTLMHVGDVYLHDRSFYATDGILKGDAGVGVRTCVQHDAIP